MNHQIIIEKQKTHDELLRYTASIAPRAGETVSIWDEETEDYVQWLVLRVDHAIKNGRVLVSVTVKSA